jgi:DNA invertase Pin-like site-specific DNA recombinase
MENTDNKYFIYVRKSTEGEERQARSIGDQLAEVREIVRKNSLDVVGSFEESQSAKTKGRPLFNEMLDRIERGEANGIIAWHPDRLARNAFDGGRIIDFIDEGKIADLRFCSFWFEPTPQGKLMLNLAFGQSKYYSDSLSVNIRRGQRQKTAEGIWGGKAPVGYLNEPKLRTIIVDPLKAPLVRMAFELYATGEYSFERLRETMTARGLRGMYGLVMSDSRYRDMLNSPFYYGVFVWKGEMHQGIHEPLVTKDLFDKVQEVMRRRSKPSPVRLKSYVYRGLFQCGECGCCITMETQKGHNYLRCTKRMKEGCSQPYLREEATTVQIAAVLTSFSLPDDLADWLVQRLNAERQQSGGMLQEAKRRLESEIEKINTKLDRLTAAYLDAGAFTAAEFRKRKEENINRKRKLLDDLAVLDRQDILRFEPITRFVNGSKQLKYVVQRANPTELRAKLEKVGSNLTIRDRKVHWFPRGAWKLVVDKGSFAQHNAAPKISGAAFVGETRLCPTKCTL